MIPTAVLIKALREGDVSWAAVDAVCSRLEAYEADRLHGHATVAAYLVSQLQQQGRLLSDATDILEGSSKANQEVWRRHLGVVDAEYRKKRTARMNDIAIAAMDSEDDSYVDPLPDDGPG